VGEREKGNAVNTTIKTGGWDVVVKPSPIGCGFVELHLETPSKNGGHRASVVMTQDQIGALIVGLEQAVAKAVAA
jgi:hypothetical protein